MPLRRQARPSTRLVLLCAAVSLAGSARAAEELPQGLPAGRFILAPFFEAAVVSDDNVFRESSDPSSDTITSVSAGLLASLPVRNSLFELGYAGNWRRYAHNQFQRNLENELGAKMRFDFGSGDRLTVSEGYTQGVSDIQAVDPGGERVFDGRPFNFNLLEVEASRSLQGRRGYTVKLSRLDLVYQDDPSDGFEFFDYHGYDGSAEYRHPIPGNLWLVGHYGFRRLDHYRDSDLRVPPGEPFRSEHADTLQVGLQGWLGRRQPFSLRLGPGRYGYDWYNGVTSSEFRGVVGAANWRLALGYKTSLDLNLQRRVLPSNSNTYYIVNELRVRLDRRFLRRSRAGLTMVVARNGYGDALPGEPSARTDRRLVIESYVDWFFHGQVGLHASVGHYLRRSNLGIADYDANVIATGLRVGWF